AVFRRSTRNNADIHLSGYRVVTGRRNVSMSGAGSSRDGQRANEFMAFSSEGMACRAWQVAAYQSCERHRIKWLRQYALGAKRDAALDLAAVHSGSQEQNRNVGSWRV